MTTSWKFIIVLPILLILSCIVVLLSNRNFLLSILTRGASSSCPSSSSEQYGVGSIPDPDPNAHANPDTVISLKGWEPFSGDLSLVTYGYPAGEPPDPKAPQLGSILNNGPQFRSLYQIRNFDPANYNDPPHLAGLSSEVGQIVLAPANGYDIGGGYQYKVIYASPNELTMNVMGSDYAIEGYSMHFTNLCVDPNLVELYTKLHNEGRRFLPTVKGGQKIGVSDSAEVIVAIRDSGSYLDPRSKLDWWSSYSIDPNPTIPGIGVPTKKVYPSAKPTKKPKQKQPTQTPIPPSATLPPGVSPTITPRGFVPTLVPTIVVEDPVDEDIEPTVFEDQVQQTSFFEGFGQLIGNTWTSVFGFLHTVAP